MGTSADPFFGKWISTEAFGDFADANEGTTYEFTEEGTLTIEKGLLFNEVTYTRDDTMIMVDLNGIEINYLYTLGDQKLELERHGRGQQPAVYNGKTINYTMGTLAMARC